MVGCDDKISELGKLAYDNPITFLASYFLKSTKYALISNTCDNKIRKVSRHLEFKILLDVQTYNSSFPKHKTVKCNISSSAF
jgi:hypothetical protein